ncbi:MAG: DNA polymerase/3'-5' exonuclease PolX [Candidatus Levyibacteriota bacterium]|nr:MAG: DNA polymerase/3'-5' exonuclease PolX [Candidatus Levybacteria bacterium]
MTNTEIATLLRNVAAAYTIKDERKFRFQIIAYQKAADAIENSTSEVKDLLLENKLELLPGIGHSIRQHLEELIKTGKVKHFNWVMDGIPASVFPLLDVPSFGPKKAHKLVAEFKLKDPKNVISDLEKIAKQNKIASLEGFGAKSQEDILQAISEYKKGRAKTKRMVLPYASELAQKVLAYLKTSNAVIQAHPLGSLRRMVSTVGDIDFAVATNFPDEVIKHFIDYPYKDRVIEQGSQTASILISGGKQIDLMVQPPDAFGSLLQHFTGSKRHNIHLREFALKKRLSLSEYGIKKAKHKTIQKYDTEEKFYKAIGLAWIPPEMREDKGEIELAAQNKLPKLVELKDIMGDLHIHSNYPIEPSHDMGKNTMEDMLKKAESLGYNYLGFSEHNPSVSKHTSSQIYSILSRRKDKIEQLNESNKYVRVINLLELDILASGKVAIDEKSLSVIDAVIVSIHSNFSMNKEEMTKRVLEGLSNPKAKILAHPTGRLLNQRAGYELDFDKIFEFCIKNNKALEINAWPTRLDLPDSLVFEAIKKGVKFVINTDSHSTWQMDMMKYGVSVARRGWATKSDILNSLPYNEFVKWLKS